MKKILLIIVVLFSFIFVSCDKEPTTDDENKQLLVEFIEVGQADAMIAILPNDEVLMIDCGYGYDCQSKAWANIRATFRKYEITKIDHLIITHNHGDHYGFVPDILNNYQVDNIYVSGSTRTNYQYLNIIEAIEASSAECYVVEVGDKIIDEENLLLQVVATKKVIEETNPNYSSVMTKLTYYNVSFMFTGDGGSSTYDAETIALASGIDLKSDVLKVGHHGSLGSTSYEWLNAVQPKYGVLTTMDNSKHGLPAPATIIRLVNRNVELYQTRECGNITFTTKGTNVQIQTMRG